MEWGIVAEDADMRAHDENACEIVRAKLAIDSPAMLRLRDFKAGAGGPMPGDVISNLSIQAGQLGTKIYVDNLEIVRTADPRALERNP